MIFIIKKWGRYEKQFKLINELLNARNVKHKISFDEGGSYIVMYCTDDIYEQMQQEVINPIVVCSGGQYTRLTGNVDLNKPISVIDLRGAPAYYYARLLPNYLKESTEPIEIIMDGKTYGFMKFDKLNPLEGDFIVCNVMHYFCEEMQRFGVVACQCPKSKRMEGGVE